MTKGLLLFGLCFPLGKMLVLGLTGNLGANPVERLIFISGQGALGILLFLLISTRVTPFFTRWKGLHSLRGYRRLMGLSLFGYATAHLTLYLADHLGRGENLLKALTRPFVISGLSAWLIFLALSLTSNRYALTRLGASWKKLHSLVWLAPPLLAVHLTLKEEGDWMTALTWFGPLLLILVCTPKRTSRS